MGTREHSPGRNGGSTAAGAVWLRRHGTRVLLGALATVAAVVALRGRVPDVGEIFRVLNDADPVWLVLALVAHILSQVAFARQQRTLLDGLAVRVSRRIIIAITYCRSAMSMVLPAGSAVSAAFAVREYRRNGASRATAATGMALSAVASLAGLALLYAVATGLPGLGVVAAVGAGGFLLRRLLPREKGPRWLRWVREVVAQARSVDLRHWVDALLCSALNWMLDLFCLVAVAYACDVPMTALQIATMYLAVQVVRQIPVTPGGVGLIEASLLAGFVAGGAPEAAAAAAVLGYRIVSFWLILPAGLAAYLRLSRCDVNNRLLQAG